MLVYSPFDDLEEYLDHILKKNKSKSKKSKSGSLCRKRKNSVEFIQPLNDSASSASSSVCQNTAKKSYKRPNLEPELQSQSSEDYELMMERMQLEAKSKIHFA